MTSVPSRSSSWCACEMLSTCCRKRPKSTRICSHAAPPVAVSQLVAAPVRTPHHGQQSAAKGSSVSRSDIRLLQYLDSSAHGLVRRWRLIGHFPIHLLPPPGPPAPCPVAAGRREGFRDGGDPRMKGWADEGDAQNAVHRWQCR
jgi:hypothetical protein